MTVEYTIYPKGMIRRHTGALTSESLLGAKHRTETLPNFTSLRWMISDLREVTAVDVSETVIEDAIASAVGSSMSNGQIRIAVIATRDDVIALANRIINAVPDHSFRVFRDLTQATQWLGVDL